MMLPRFMLDADRQSRVCTEAGLSGSNDPSPQPCHVPILTLAGRPVPVVEHVWLLCNICQESTHLYMQTQDPDRPSQLLRTSDYALTALPFIASASSPRRCAGLVDPPGFGLYQFMCRLGPACRAAERHDQMSDLVVLLRQRLQMWQRQGYSGSTGLQLAGLGDRGEPESSASPANLPGRHALPLVSKLPPHLGEDSNPIIRGQAPLGSCIASARCPHLPGTCVRHERAIAISPGKPSRWTRRTARHGCPDGRRPAHDRFGRSATDNPDLDGFAAVARAAEVIGMP